MQTVTIRSIATGTSIVLAAAAMMLTGCAKQAQSVPAAVGGGTPPQIQQNAVKQQGDTQGYAMGGQSQPAQPQPAGHP